MGVTQSLTLTQQSQSVVNNYSIVKLLWTSTQSGDSRNGYTRTASYWVSINGGAETQYSVSYTLPQNATKTIAEVNITVPHKTDGTGSISVRTWMDTDISAGVITKNAALTLTTIPRMSTLAVGDGTLGVEKTISITKQADSFTHTIVWTCGDMKGIVCEKSSAKKLNWTQPLSTAHANTTGGTVSVRFYISTYAPGVEDAIGTTFTNATYTIPANIRPYFSITKTDDNSKCAGYGFVQGLSKLKLVISGAASSYGATITGYKTEFEGKTYSGASFVSNTIVNSGEIPVKISVTDSRGRTTVVTETITVSQYKYPKITVLSATRCTQNGIIDESGEYIRAAFGYEGSSVNGKNSFTCQLQQKKTSETTFTKAWESGFYDTSFTHYCVFAADSESSYDVTFSVTDDFTTVHAATVGASAKKVFSALKQDGDIVGWAFGKTAEEPGVFDVGWQTRLSGGLLHPVLPTNTNVDTLLTPQTWMLLSANSYTGLPEGVISGYLEIVGIKNGSLIQRLSIFSKANPTVYERIHYATTGWGAWLCVRGDFVVEQGEKDGWTYRKWNSGDYECWKIVTFTTSITTQWGAFYTSGPLARQNYPFPFTSKPAETVQITAGSVGAILYPEAGGNGVNGAYASAMYCVCRPSAINTTETFYLNFNIKGKWK